MLRAQSIVSIIEKLQHIQTRVVEQRHLKFYYSSLLIDCEGDMNAEFRVEVRIIDFAHTQWVEYDGDQGFLLGINNLLGLLRGILSKTKTRAPAVITCNCAT